MPEQFRQIRQLGQGGVNVDENPLDLEDIELQQSKNATFISLSAKQRALVQRPGLQKFNTLSFGANVLGGVEAPYQNTAGAPSSGGGGGGNPGDPGGTGGPTGGPDLAPGDPFPTGSSPTTGPGPILAPGAGPVVFGGSPLILIARAETSGASATVLDRSGWYLTSEGFLSGAYRLNVNSTASGALQVPFGPPGYNPNVQLASPATGFIDFAQGSSNRTIGQKLFTIANGTLYYPQQFGSGAVGLLSVTGTLQLPAIRKLSADGTTDSQIVVLPDNLSLKATDASGVKRISLITSMVTQWGNGDALFVAVEDVRSATGTVITGRHGRVLYITGLDSGNYVVTEVFNSLTYPTGPFNSTVNDAVSYTLANFMGNLWVGSYNGQATGTGAWFGMLRPTSAAGFPNGWAFSHGNPVNGGDVALADVTCMQEYSGALYIGTINRSTSGAQIFRYGSDNTLSSVLTGAPGASGTVALNQFCSMEVFSGALFASYFNTTAASGAKIYNTVNGASGTWTGVFTGAGATSFCYNLKAYDGYLYAWGGSGITATSEHFLTTQTGTTWVDQTASIATSTGGHGATTTSAALGILFKIPQ